MENVLTGLDNNFSDSDITDNDVLLPIASLFPANEIITKNYAPDTKPNFKLMYDFSDAGSLRKNRRKK